ncbi:glucoside xylosyltransferase 1-like [Ptychodera flava]|uniref:glucoside xylosyltransferase 1-like n=1 Tax=Ptychodera flava TaxID=63121 RepID=UPI00396A426D
MRFKRKVLLLFCVFVSLLFFYFISEEPEQGHGGVGSDRHQAHNYNQDQRRLQRVEHPVVADTNPRPNPPDQNLRPANPKVQNVVKNVLKHPREDDGFKRLPNQPAVVGQPAVVHPPAPQQVPVAIPKGPREPVIPRLPAQRNSEQAKLYPGNGIAQPPGFQNNLQQNGQVHPGQGKAPVFNIGQPNLIFDRSQLRGPAVQQNVPVQQAAPFPPQGQDPRQNFPQGDLIVANNQVLANAQHQGHQPLQQRQQPPPAPQFPQRQQPPALQLPQKPPQQQQNHAQNYQSNNQNVNIFKNGIHLSVVACGDRANETLVMLKSAVLFTKAPLHFHIFAEDDLHDIFRVDLEKWPPKYRSRINYDIHSITFPPGENAVEWKKLFKPCASQRLFLPDVLTNVDSLLYVDTDVLFLFPLDEIWEFFRKFNDTQLAAMTPEHEALSIGWYNRFAQHPYYGETGVNSGVMLMNLTRIRKFGWTKKIVPIYKEYKLKITWGDQDLLNILFHFHPELLYVYPCEWNYRPDHCMYSSLCKRAEQVGIKVVHGNRGVFHNEKQMAFRSIYEALSQYKLGEDPRENLIEPMNNGLMATMNTPCGKLTDAFLKTLVQSVMNIS